MQTCIKSCILIFIFMVTVWGLLAKSQIDSETIEEMVDRKISEHEADPESHMGTGESIDVHRKTEIVDHKVGSVLNDKFTMTEFTYTNQFNNADNINFTNYGDVTNGEIRLYIETGYGPKSIAYIAFYRPQPFLTLEKDFLMQFLAQRDTSDSSGKIYMGLNADNEDIDYAFVGFQSIEGVVKCIAKLDGGTHLSSAISVDLSEPHIFRFQNIAGEKKIYYYIDGQLVHTVTYTTESISGDGTAYFHHEVTEENDGYLYIMDVFLSRGTV